MTRRKKTPKFYFSFSSPYAWLAAQKLRDRNIAWKENIQWCPYWIPDSKTLEDLAAVDAHYLYEDMSRPRRFYILQDVKRLCKAKGLEFQWPAGDDVWWEISHLGFFIAQQEGCGEEYLWAMLDARWRQGASLSDPEIVKQVCAKVGLDYERIMECPHDPAIRKQGLEIMQQAYDDQVFGVPFMVYGYERFWGQDRVEEFCDYVDSRI